MKKILAILFLGLILISCSSDGPKDCCTIIDAAIDLRILDSEGNNLLDLEDGYTETDISAFNKINNQWKRSSDSPRIFEREGENLLRVFANLDSPNAQISELKLEFTHHESDIIKTELLRENSNIIVTRVWYNDILKWEVENNSERIIEVEK